MYGQELINHKVDNDQPVRMSGKVYRKAHFQIFETDAIVWERGTDYVGRIISMPDHKHLQVEWYKWHNESFKSHEQLYPGHKLVVMVEA